MGIVLVDGREVQVADGERLNAIQAAKRAGVEIPHYCWHPGLSVVGSCRMCLVEVGTRTAAGQISMLPKLMPGCNTPVKDGTVIVTTSEKVQQSRAQVEEGLLLRHPVDCPICDKAGECTLQDYYFNYGQAQRRADIRPFTSRRRDIGDVTLFVDRCVMCSRCVRFTREISGTSELMVTHRGAHEEIDVVPGFPLNNKLSGNVVDLCPVGALGDKDFLYRQRVWYLKRQPGVCTGCATGCSIWIEYNHEQLFRIKPRENPQVNQWWMCNEGRYDYHHVHDQRRLVGIRRRDGGAVTELDWRQVPGELRMRLGEAGPLAAVLSPYLSVEEAWLLAQFIRGLDPQAALVLGPVPVVGEDERFTSGFVISAEKAPNRRGVEEILVRLTGGVTRFEEWITGLDGGAPGGVWFSGGYKEPDWIDEALAAKLERAKLLVVQDLFPSAVSRRATYELGGAAYAERNGSHVNRNDHLQQMRWAVRPPAGVRPEGSLFWELSARSGLYDAEGVLRELAAEIGYFHLAGREVPEIGVNLKANLLADASEATGSQHV